MDVTNAAIASEIALRVRDRIGSLRGKSFAELASLHGVENTRLDIFGEVVWLNVYPKAQDQDSLLFVVQAHTDRSFDYALNADKTNVNEIKDDLFHVEGFIARANGVVLEAPNELLWPYQPAA